MGASQNVPESSDWSHFSNTDDSLSIAPAQPMVPELVKKGPQI